VNTFPLRWAVISLALIFGSANAFAADSAKSHAVHALKITVLVTNLAGDPHEGDGEWGYSALVEVDGHYDHVGGLMALRRELAKINPRAISRVHVGAGVFEPRLNASGEDQNGLRLIKSEYLATGGVFIVHDKPTEIFPGMWLTGPVPRPNSEKNWTPGLSLATPKGLIEDNVPEDSALLFDTDQGMVILTGCAHAGIVNITEFARSILGVRPIVAVIGGLHLFAASDEALAWTGAKLKSYGMQSLLAGHCTGIEATYRLRSSTGLTRKTAIVSAVGSSFTLGKGFDPRRLAQ
jgi:7,8-dihydropterin-6-yl-methyl-4-(beta-D-ribofuranosyl)aminobenzene 5'-phosphate synthase